ncbi:MAG TPA: hypothetical protein VI756_11580 [Blastocatellia bacterium]
MDNIPLAQIWRQRPSDWSGDFELPQVVASYYQEIGPVDMGIESIGNAWFLPSHTSLWEFQGGYRFNTISGQRLGDWIADWLATAGGRVVKK